MWTIFGKDPVWQVLSNAVPSFAVVLLIFVLIYKLLCREFISFGQIWQNFWKRFDLKLSIASFAALFYSLFFTEILYSQMEWNPNGGTFWLIIFILFLEKFWYENHNLKPENELKNTKVEFLVNKLTVSDNLPNLEKIEENSNKSSTQNQSLKNETTNENIFLAQKNKKNLKLNQNNAQNSDIQISQKSLSYSKIIQTVKSHFDKSFTVSKLFKNFILYSSFGLVVNVILSLHSTFLFVLPPFLIKL